MTTNMQSDCKFVRLRWMLFFVIIAITILCFSDYAIFLHRFLVRNSPYIDGHREKVTSLKYFINLYPCFISAILYCFIFLPKVNIRTALKLFWIAPLVAFLANFTGSMPEFFLLEIGGIILAAAIYLILTLKFNTPFIFIFVLIGGILNGFDAGSSLLTMIENFIFMVFCLFNIAVGVIYILKHRWMQSKHVVILMIGMGFSVFRLYSEFFRF